MDPSTSAAAGTRDLDLFSIPHVFGFRVGNISDAILPRLALSLGDGETNTPSVWNYDALIN